MSRRRGSPRLQLRRWTRDHLGVSRQVRYSLAWDLLAGALAGLFMGMTFPFFTKIARGELDAPQSAIAVMMASPFIGNLFSPLWAQQMEGKNKIPFCVYSWSVARALLFFMPFAVTGGVFVALTSLMQIIGTFSSPAYASLMRDIYPNTARGRLMGYVRVALQAAAFLATSVTGRMMDSGVSFRYLFPVAGLFGIGAALAFQRVRPLPGQAVTEPPARESPTDFLKQTLAILHDNVAYRWFALSVFVYGFANLMVQPLYGLYQVDELHITSTQIADLTNAAALSAIVGSFFWGRFMDRYGPPHTVMLSIFLITVVPLVYLMTRDVNGLLFAAALSGLGFSGIELSYLASILLYAEPHRTAQYQSLHSLLLGIRGVLAPLLGVPLVEVLGYRTVFIIALVAMLSGMLLQGLAIATGRTRVESA